MIKEKKTSHPIRYITQTEIYLKDDTVTIEMRFLNNLYARKFMERKDTDQITKIMEAYID